MLRIDIPGRSSLAIEYLALDLNGTIACDGNILPGTAEALARLTPALTPLLLTADTHGTADSICTALGIQLCVIPKEQEATAKLRAIERLGVARVAAIGNGANDASMLAAAALGICVTGPEGAAVSAIQSADVAVPDIDAALGLLLRPQRLIATLRT